MKYNKKFKEEALNLSDEVGVKKQHRSLAYRITLYQVGGMTARQC